MLLARDRAPYKVFLRSTNLTALFQLLDKGTKIMPGYNTKHDVVQLLWRPEFRNGVGSIPVEGSSPSIDGWIV